MFISDAYIADDTFPEENELRKMIDDIYLRLFGLFRNTFSRFMS